MQFIIFAIRQPYRAGLLALVATALKRYDNSNHDVFVNVVRTCSVRLLSALNELIVVAQC